VAREDGGPYFRTCWLRRKQLRKMIIRKTERLRMNILSILPPRSSLEKMKMLKMFKMLKETTR
jgi:hypothetical protein